MLTAKIGDSSGKRAQARKTEKARNSGRNDTMKVLVTGASGFVGKHMTKALLEAGHEVRALVRGFLGNRENSRMTQRLRCDLGVEQSKVTINLHA